MKKILCVFIIFFMQNVAAYASKDFLKILSAKDHILLEFALPKEARPEVFTLNHPDRLVVDITQSKKILRFSKIKLMPPINDLRHGFPLPNTQRFVFDLTRAIHFKKDITAQNILTIRIDQSLQATNVIQPTLHVAQPRLTLKDAVAPTLANKKLIVVIDAGHGGKDPGTIGQGGVREKDVVLDIAYRLARLVANEPNMQAYLTRRGDYFVPLRNRLRLARKFKGDLFIAVHADSYFNKQSNGASIYALSRHGATNEAARWLAKRDNTSELGGVDLGDKDYILRSVLIDLSQTATIVDSVKLGTNILSALSRITRLHYRRVEQAPFMVLKSPDIPSILIETGFLSNPHDEANLQDGRYRDSLARAMLNGLRRFTASHPSINTI